MKLRSILCACVSFFALTSNSVAFVGNTPGAVTVSLSDAYYHFASKRNLSNIWMPNVALAYNFDNHWAVEAGAGLLNTYMHRPLVTSVTKTHGFLYTATGIYRIGSYCRFEPYVAAGLGMLTLRPYSTDSQYQGNINAGVGTQWFVSPQIAFRAEARDLYTIAGGKNDFMLNFGMSFLFGGGTPYGVAKIAT
ncbi:MAG: outer membrane beta-barrel protein [Gammaproteobacteria bacterium]